MNKRKKLYEGTTIEVGIMDRDRSNHLAYTKKNHTGKRNQILVIIIQRERL